MIERLHLSQFTAFDDLDISFSPGINLFIGNNGTGKTHILKILYTSLSALHEGKRVSDKIVEVFLPRDRQIGRLVKRRKGSATAKVGIHKNGKILRLHFTNHTKGTLKWTNGWGGNKIEPSVYIPVKEMLANAPGFVSLYESREIHFEEVYRDIILKAFKPIPRGPIPADRRKLLVSIQKVIEGKVVSKNEQFFLKNREGELEFTLLAEGMRKLALLWLLIQNGSLLGGAKLFWDEPEANLNPSMLEGVANILLQLQRHGLQIFIATHNYVLLKKFDLCKTQDNDVRFFTLERGEDGRISYRSGNSYLDILPNKISDAYIEIYNEEVKKSFGGAQHDNG